MWRCTPPGGRAVLSEVCGRLKSALFCFVMPLPGTSTRAIGFRRGGCVKQTPVWGVRRRLRRRLRHGTPVPPRGGVGCVLSAVNHLLCARSHARVQSRPPTARVLDQGACRGSARSDARPRCRSSSFRLGPCRELCRALPRAALFQGQRPKDMLCRCVREQSPTSLYHSLRPPPVLGPV